MAKILLAEDDHSMGNFIEMALTEAGHEVYTAQDGLEALSIIDKNDQGASFDLLLTDIVMPGMDGIELSQIAQKKLPNIKVVFITGFKGVASKTQAMPSHKVIAKPFHLNDLVDQVHKILKG